VEQQPLNLLQFRRAVVHSYVMKYRSRPDFGRPIGRSLPLDERLPRDVCYDGLHHYIDPLSSIQTYEILVLKHVQRTNYVVHEHSSLNNRVTVSAHVNFCNIKTAVTYSQVQKTHRLLSNKPLSSIQTYEIRDLPITGVHVTARCTVHPHSHFSGLKLFSHLFQLLCHIGYVASSSGNSSSPNFCNLLTFATQMRPYFIVHEQIL